MAATAAVVALTGVGLPASAAALSDVPLSSAYVTNGDVTAVTTDSYGRVYIGGFFNEIGPRLGHGLALTTSDDQPATGWPDVNGHVDAVASDGVGGWFIGGQFSDVGGIARDGLAHIESDGTVDPSWSPDVSGGGPPQVNALVVSGGRLYVGGQFTSVGGAARSDLAAVSASGTGSVDSTWDPEPNGQVLALQLGGGEMFVGGAFTSIAGQSLGYLAELSTGGSGAADSSWNPAPNGPVESLALNGSALFAGGQFLSIGGQSRTLIAKLSSGGTGAADPTWDPAITYPPHRIPGVDALAISGGELFAGGIFAAGAHTNLAAFSTTGSGAVDAGWNPSGLSGYPFVNALAVSAEALYVAGSDVGSDNQSLVRIPLTGSAVDAGWDPAPNGPVDVLAIAGQRIYAGGNFTSAGSDQVPTHELARLNPDGTVDQSWHPTYEGCCLLAASAAELYTVGGADQVADIPIGGSGALKATWEAWPDQFGSIESMVAVGDDLYVGGEGLEMISTTGHGRVDPSWNPAPNGAVTSLAVAGSSLYVGGGFTSIGGVDRNGLARLSLSTGVVDPGWDPSFTFPSGVYDKVGPLVVAGNSLYAAGDFDSVDSQPLDTLAKISTGATASVDPDWNPDPAGEVTALTVAGSYLYAGGSFSSIGGEPVKNLAAIPLTGTGAADPSWAPDPAGVGGLASSGQGLVAVGDFTSAGPLSSEGFAIFGPLQMATATIATPADGATYTTGEDVDASYSCSDLGGSQAIAECSASVPSGSPLDTSTVGEHSFTVTATDQDGNVSTQTADYTVVAPPEPWSGMTTGQAPRQLAFKLLRHALVDRGRMLIVRVQVPGAGGLRAQQCARPLVRLVLPRCSRPKGSVVTPVFRVITRPGSVSLRLRVVPRVRGDRHEATVGIIFTPVGRASELATFAVRLR